MSKKSKSESPVRRLQRCPKPPARLSKHARDEWQRLATVAHRLGTLTEADLRGFELLVETLATERSAREAVVTAGMTVPTGDGGMKPHPAVRIMETARNQAARLLESFGLNPKGRGSIETAPKEARKDSSWRGILS